MIIVHEEEVRSTGKRLLYGWLRTLDTGERIYVARRKHREIFRSGRASISGAMTDAAAAWAIDESLLLNMRAKGVKRIFVDVEDTGDLWETTIERFFDRKLSKIHDYTGVGRGGSRQRYLPLPHWEKTPGTARLDARPVVS